MDDARRAATGPGSTAAEPRPQTAGQGAPQSPRHHRSRGSRTPRHRSTEIDLKSRRRRLLRRSVMAAIAALGVTVAILIALLLRTTHTLSATRDQLKGEVQAEQFKAEQAAAEVQRLTLQLQDLVNGRLPKPLQAMLTGTLIELEPAPLRRILFTQVGTPERPGYEYRLECRNDGPERVQPLFRILLFNGTGIQTGSADLSDSADAARLGAGGIAAGESVSFSGSVRLEFDDTPKYFMIVGIAADGQLPRLAP